MRSSRSLKLVVGAAVAAVAVAGVAVPASAIVHGTPDSQNTFSNVGSMLVTVPDGEGGELTFQACTGTMISETVFLTAAHCLYDTPAEWKVTFTLDRVIDSNNDGLVDDSVTRIVPTGWASHPKFPSNGANNAYDVAVLTVDEGVPGDYKPAALPPLGWFETAEGRTNRYVAVGYGTVRDTKRTASQALSPGSERKYAEQSVNSINKSWANFSMNPSTGNGGTCYGDSGGPHFPQGTNIVASLTVTGDRWCKSTDRTYRLDTAEAQDFLAPFLHD